MNRIYCRCPYVRNSAEVDANLMAFKFLLMMTEILLLCIAHIFSLRFLMLMYLLFCLYPPDNFFTIRVIGMSNVVLFFFFFSLPTIYNFIQMIEKHNMSTRVNPFDRCYVFALSSFYSILFGLSFFLFYILFSLALVCLDPL